jgi:hypothetical protein
MAVRLTNGHFNSWNVDHFLKQGRLLKDLPVPKNF